MMYRILDSRALKVKHWKSDAARIELDLTLAHTVDDGMRYYFGLVV